MPHVFEGQPGPVDGRFAIVVARFNQTITGRLLDGALSTLAEHGVTDERVDVFRVPGAFEIPTLASRLAWGGNYAAVICLGAVIRGETSHDQHINRALGNTLAALGAETGVPVIFGVLTCNTLEQAVARSGGEATTGKDAADKKVGNKGIDAALTALEMVDLLGKLP